MKKILFHHNTENSVQVFWFKWFKKIHFKTFTSSHIAGTMSGWRRKNQFQVYSVQMCDCVSVRQRMQEGSVAILNGQKAESGVFGVFVTCRYVCVVYSRLDTVYTIFQTYRVTVMLSFASCMSIYQFYNKDK